MTDNTERDALLAEITAAIEDYRRVFPEPCALAPNLELASRASTFLLAEREPVVVDDATEWEYAVRQHDGRVWDVDLDDEPWTRESAIADADEIRGGHVVRRRKAGPWAAFTPEGQEGAR